MAAFTSALKSRVIYVFGIADELHRGCLKIGETTLREDIDYIPKPGSEILNKAASDRIEEYTRTCGVSFQLLYTEMTMFMSGGRFGSFNDKQVHEILDRSGVARKVFKDVNAREWYCCDLETVKKAISAAKKGLSSLNPGDVTQGQTPILFRPEQMEAIDKTIRQFKKGNKMLWYAKMRFGKTLCALQVVREAKFRRTLILTHRPVVDNGWFEDYGKIFYDRKDHHYGSRNKGESFGRLEKLAAKGDSYVYFASMQDLRGSEEVGGRFDKNDEVFSAPWDLLIVDEAHEGTKTDLGASVIDALTKPETKVLKLSGTPFNLLDDYNENEVFVWDYIMEQRAKSEWDSQHIGEFNPYAGLPAIRVCTYNLGNSISGYADDERAFNFREFFRTGESGNFIHGIDVDRFLNLLCKEDKDSLYPYSNERFRKIFRHTLWVVPGVAAAKALSSRLQKHPVFGQFTVVNVAGDGDDDEESSDALQMVESAIGGDPDETWTITLSCGRLTTGVSIKPWTAVFMMAGSFSTSASQYLQTIFRVQTPFTCHGRMKTECFVFDFAPDRSLRVFAEAVHVSTRAGKQTESDRKQLGEFLNFCPIISIDGSEMKPYDVERMMGELKRAQIERVVQDGFENGALYNDELLKLTDVDLKDFAALKKQIGATRAMPKTGDIDVNRQGFTDEEYDEKGKLEKKPKKELTEEEKKRLEELRKKGDQRRNAISILRGISIRMPLLIYGAELKDEESEITLENFTDLVDDVSWEEFMPRGVTKRTFKKFRKYYDPDVFREAGKRIREMARAADRFSIEERILRITTIFNTFRNPDKETVLTPWRVVNMHLSDCLGGYCFYDQEFRRQIEEPRFVRRGSITGEVFDPEQLVMEINSKSGLYPLYCAYSIYRKRLENVKGQPGGEEESTLSKSLWDATIENNIFVVCKTPMAVSITKRTLAGFRNIKVNAKYYSTLAERLSTNTDAVVSRICDGKIFWNKKDKKHMKFNLIVGNPPYQEEGLNTRKQPIYHLFYDLAFKLSNKATLITPGRFLFMAGQTPKDWMSKMLKDKHLKIIRYFPKSTDVFPTVDIKGGVVITYRDSNENFGPIEFFSPYPELTSIYKKVIKDNTARFNTIVSSQGMYRFSEHALSAYPEILNVQGKGTAAKITSRAFENLPNIFTEHKQSSDSIRILGRSKGKRVYKWILRDNLQKCEYLQKYNVLLPEANGTGAIGEQLSSPLIAEPGTGHTDTFISIGHFDTKTEATACLKFICTKFCRALLGTLKATQHNPSDTWANIPLLDFQENGQIDWTMPVPEIDKTLYKIYGLSDTEIQFLESTIKPME